MAVSTGDLEGNEPLFRSDFPKTSLEEIMNTPIKDAITPRSFLKVNLSTLSTAPNRRVQTLLVDARIVELATLVCSSPAATK